MQISTPQSASASDAIMASLIELLGEMPTGKDRARAEATAERLDRLEYEARWSGAREETLVAIKGARILMALAELPPLPRSRR